LAGLDRAEMAVWLLLWRDTKPEGLARTSQADLARRAGCNPRTVRRALAALQSAGLVAVVRRGGLNRGLSVYRVDPLGVDADRP
jgi:DNA-binding IclR family transcriptional regulator